MALAALVAANPLRGVSVACQSGMSNVAVRALVASLRNHDVPRYLAHPHVHDALVAWAQLRSGEVLVRKCWTLACMAHANRGAVALDAPANVSQAVTAMQLSVAAELELVLSLDEDMAEDDEDRMAAAGCINKLRLLDQAMLEDQGLSEAVLNNEDETRNFVLLIGSATSKRRAAYVPETGWAGGNAAVVQWAAALDGTREGAGVFLASLRDVLLSSATALSTQEFVSAVLGRPVRDPGRRVTRDADDRWGAGV